MAKLIAVLQSRRFYATLIGAGLVYINSQLQILDEASMAQVVAVISAWIIGTSIAPNTPNA